ncbi:MAG: hypothetical protein BWX70_01215 [Verrucomicrobia bacterium ADurb.Bin070]|nr:MAG: hypothetical protein BWX70_01215 [Verrucomicrobia bacterium ADurb.Bin070]
MAGIPQLGRRAEHVAERAEPDVLHERIGLQRRDAGVVALGLGLAELAQQLDGVGLRLAQRLHQGAARNALSRELAEHLSFDRRESVKGARGLEAERGGGLAGGPDIGQTLDGVLFHLDTEIVTGRTGLDAGGSAVAAAVVADDRLDGGEQLGSGHQADRHARPGEDRLDDLAVGQVGHDHAVLDGVAADDAAGRDVETEDRVVGVGELVDHLEGRRTAVEDARVGLLENHHAGGLDARIAGVNRGGEHVGDGHVGQESAALLDVQHRLLPLFPASHGDTAADHAGVHADVGQRLGEGESGAPRLAILAGLRRGAGAHVLLALLGRALLDDRPKAEVVDQAGGGGAAVDPREFKGEQAQRQVARSLDDAAVLRVEARRGDARFVERLVEPVLGLGPLVRRAFAVGHQTGHEAAGHRTGAHHGHLNVVPVGIAPHDLANLVAGQHLHGLRGLTHRVEPFF